MFDAGGEGEELSADFDRSFAHIRLTTASSLVADSHELGEAGPCEVWYGGCVVGSCLGGLP